MHSPARWFLLAVLGGAAAGPAPGLQTPLAPLGAGGALRSAAPATWQDGGDRDAAAAPPVAFWQSFADATLQRLLAEALQSNHDVRGAHARVRVARAARLDAALDLAPTLTASAGYTRQRLASATFPGTSGTLPSQDVWDAGLDLSWELDLFGRLRRSSQGHGALADAAQEDVRDVLVLIAAELAAAYFDLRGAQDRLAVARRNAENQRRTLELTLQRLDAGRGTAFDSERAQAQLSSTLAAIPALEAAVAAGRHRIGVLVGRRPADLARELEEEALPAAVLPESILVSSPDSVIRRRPDVRSAERRVAAGRAFVGAARAAYLPRIAAAGTMGYASNDFTSLGNAGTPRYAFGPVVSWPALNLGRVKAEVDAARARESEADARYQQTRLRALEEVETSLVAYHNARRALLHLEDAAGASERAAELARLRFEEGVTDFLQVLDAERTLLDAQDRLAVGRTSATGGLVTVYRALGGTGRFATQAER